MNIIMDTQTQSLVQKYNEFMSKQNIKQLKPENGAFTHTRIPDKELSIFGGTFYISEETRAEFYKLYYDYVFVRNNKEYLTEKQTVTGGTLAVDFDFRYSYDITERQHTKEHISDMICEYVEVIKECYTITATTSFDVFVFEKPNVNRLKEGNITKDGIHMLIGLQVDYTMQAIIRNKMMQKLSEIWELPLTNTWGSVLDEGISKGTTNWQLFGSRKPGNEAYEFKYHYHFTVDKSDLEFQMDELDVCKFDLKTNFEKLSVQYTRNPKLEINPKIRQEYESMLNKKTTVKKASSKIKRNFIIANADDEEEESYILLDQIKDFATLEKAMNHILKNLTLNEYDIKETHQFTQALPEKYYEPGSHLLNRKVAFALKHTDDRLFLSWVMLRSKAADFDYESIPELYETWKQFHKSNTNNECVTRRSIMFWVKHENEEEYNRIKETTIDYYLDNALKDGTEYDFALILKQMYKDNYVCISYDKKGIWYQFKNHRWEIDRGLSLRSKISEELRILVEKKADALVSDGLLAVNGDTDDPIYVAKAKKAKHISELSLKLKKTNDKNNIMREAAEIFYDSEFIKNMDKNKYLMCFNNGVVDFKNKIFREGYPEDYITKSTKINYIPYDMSSQEDSSITQKIEYLNTFMRQLFPVEDLTKYMWEHLASCLIGSNKNQTFNVYHGSGSNGKSILTELMSVTLGEYKGTVPITLVTEKRGLIGGTSDEVLKLKGVRYAVMQEPSKGVKLNEGIMKELTGGDPIQARGLYCESEIFEPQFNLVVCTNNLFDIQSNDDGTWRRIRKCDFISKFKDDSENYTDKTDYVFPKDKFLKDKFPELAPVFASMLVNIAFRTEGIVAECETVQKSSEKYRKNQDHLDCFITDNIIRTNDPTDSIAKKEVKDEFEKWYEMSYGSNKKVKIAELYEAIEKKFDPIKLTKNKSNKLVWVGLKLDSYSTQDAFECGNEG